MASCRICASDAVAEWLDFGPQALRNRYLHSSDESEYRHPLSIGFCGSCGTVQLADPPPVAELCPRFGWINYNEPERHLDAVVAAIARLPGITSRSVIAGLTYKDDSTLARLNRLGFTATRRPDLHADFGVASPFGGIESVQARLTPAIADALASKYGRPDVLIVRHVLEHAHDPRTALAWAASLVRPGGYVVFEAPDAVRALERLDYTTVWEEHVLYFTTHTLRGCLERAGFEVLSLVSYPYTLENSLVAIARAGGTTPVSPVDSREVARGDRFIRAFSHVRDRMHQELRGRGRIAMLGAGHMTGAFVNLYGLAGLIDFVADDNPNKHGLFMSGSRLPILPSPALVERDIDLCLMTVRPEIEDAVAARNAAFVNAGGTLASVFPDSPYSLARCKGVLA